MDFDYEIMEGELPGFCGYSEEDIQEGLKKLKSMSEDEIVSLSKSLEDALNEEWTKWRDDLLDDEFYKDGLLDDEFYEDNLETAVNDYMAENGFIEQISINSCGKVAEMYGLPGTIIYHLYTTGQLPL